MITGRVVDGVNPTVPITLLGPDEVEMEVSAILDTGFTGALTLSRRQIEELSLVLSGGCATVLADGQILESLVYQAKVRLNDHLLEVRAIEVPDAALIGMELLKGYRVRMDVIDEGSIVIERLPPDVAPAAN